MKNLYNNPKWHHYSSLIKKRDGYRCVKCKRGDLEVILQVHHLTYRRNYDIWDYPLSDCVTLCKGCHAREHNLIEPNDGWELISIHDREDLDGYCERRGCGTEIRYEHEVYHPKCGYMIVGSTCVDFLTQENQLLSSGTLKFYKRAGDFVYSSEWERSGNISKPYIYSTHNHHQIRIYGEKEYAFQILIKQKGRKWFDFQKVIQAKNKSLRQVKELAYICLLGLTTKNEDEKEILRSIYMGLK